MDIDLAIRLTQILLGFAFIQQSVEHYYTSQSPLFIARVGFSIMLILGIYLSIACYALFIISMIMLCRLNGPYNGGSDRMSLLILTCVCVMNLLPDTPWRDYIFGYLAVQVILSYFIAGWVKVMNPEWRNGRALQDVFSFSAYPVSESLRGFANRPRLMCAMSWAVILFEILFPLAFLNQTMLIIALSIAIIFHIANACLFGFNRFFWIWIAAYPSLFWLQEMVF